MLTRESVKAPVSAAQTGGNGQISSPAPAPAIKEEHFVLIRQAGEQYKVVRRAAKTALSSSITLMVLGGLAIPLLVQSADFWNLLISLGLCMAGVVEFLGYLRLRRGKPSATKVLAANQLGLLVVIAAYCLGQIVLFSPDQAKAAVLSPEVRSQLSALPSMQRAVDQAVHTWAPIFTYGFYGLVLVLSVGFQGGMAWYYFTRRRALEAFFLKTPEWVRQMVLVGAG